MAALGYCLGRVAPFYNLVLVAIVIVLFLKLFTLKNKHIFLKPWRVLFFGVMVYVAEEIITVLEGANLIAVSKLLFPLLEMIIISLFIYMLLLQKEHVKK
ncbi:hypothetical protein HYU14_02905 [Candidatus Woesearchaeota archaeon]|nr:hypothetical protein [Candidatus Woesearchaeota archaeon]